MHLKPIPCQSKNKDKVLGHKFLMCLFEAPLFDLQSKWNGRLVHGKKLQMFTQFNQWTWKEMACMDGWTFIMDYSCRLPISEIQFMKVS